MGFQFIPESDYSSYNFVKIGPEEQSVTYLVKEIDFESVLANHLNGTRVNPSEAFRKIRDSSKDGEPGMTVVPANSPKTLDVLTEKILAIHGDDLLEIQAVIERQL